MNTLTRKPNALLRRERELRGWTLERAAQELFNLCEDGASKRGGVNGKMISRWELGTYPPSRFYQEKLLLLYGKSLEELGLIEPLQPPEHFFTHVSQDSQPGTAFLPASHQNIEDLLEGSEATPEEQVARWLSLGADDMAFLFQEGWSVEDILTALRVVLKGVQAMSTISRRALGRTFLQIGAAAVLGSIPIPSGRQISAEDRTELFLALGASIGEGWKLFHTAGNTQVLAIAQAQLSLIKRISPLLFPHDQASLFSPVYRLIGAAYHLQGRYEEALDAHHKAYLAALEGMDVWNMAQSRIWQASGFKEQGDYDEALQAIAAALRLTSRENDVECMRTSAHLLASGAEIASLMGNAEGVHSRLSASAEWLERLPGQHEEFDRAGWHEIAGVCALHLQQDEIAVQHLTQAREMLLPDSTLRHITACMPLVMAYANSGERNLSLSTAEHALPLLYMMNAPAMNRQFVEYTTCALTSAFPHDSDIHRFLSDTRRQLLPQNISPMAG